MAIIQNGISSAHQLTVPNAYFKIDNIIIRNKEIRFDLLMYASKQARLQGASPIQTYSLNSDIRLLPPGEDIYQQLYIFVKGTNEDYRAAEDDL